MTEGTEAWRGLESVAKSGFSPTILTPEVALSVGNYLRFIVLSQRLIGLIFRVFCVSCGEFFCFSFACCAFIIGGIWYFPFLSSHNLDEWTLHRKSEV